MRGDASDQIPPLDASQLTEEQRVEAKAKHDQLFHWLLSLPTSEDPEECLVLTRQGVGHMWVQSGVIVSRKDQMIYGKIGTHPYQPLGRYDGEHFVPLKGTQVFWSREFATARRVLIDPAFRVESVTPDIVEVDGVALSDEESRLMAEGREDLRKALEEYKAAQVKFATEKAAYDLEVELWEKQTGGKGMAPITPADPQEDLLDALKLWAMRIKRLDGYLISAQKQYEESQNTKESLLVLAVKGHTVDRIVFGVTEWLDMKLQDDLLRKKTEETLLTVPGTDRDQRLNTLLTGRLESSADDVDLIKMAIDTVYVSSPKYRERIEVLMGEGKTSLEIRDLLLGELKGAAVSS